MKCGVRLAQPLHLCFGVLHKRGTQRIAMEVELEAGASATFIAHCLFPDANVSLRLHWGHDRRHLVAAVGHSIFNRSCKTDVGAVIRRGLELYEREEAAP